ncbi:hypothetical protein DCS_03305 [Drechmeria coniospora]|uniref:Uncharacterized protein n=1 Tax=Drechmeria coniospora TaxID=98403 RepID=A0A151GYH1_DRECN|nr:hypothetical protein DCS_03305 [Drechmeria coniospora]KYK62158.1 hypothetical protein DCS_03305 [Drechmeria coniospora]
MLPSHRSQCVSRPQHPLSERPDEASSNEASPDEASPSEASPIEASPDEASASEASPIEASPTEASPSEASPNEASPNEASPNEASPNEASPAEASLDKRRALKLSRLDESRLHSFHRRIFLLLFSSSGASGSASFSDPFFLSFISFDALVSSAAYRCCLILPPDSAARAALHRLSPPASFACVVVT